MSHISHVFPEELTLPTHKANTRVYIKYLMLNRILDSLPNTDMKLIV